MEIKPEQEQKIVKIGIVILLAISSLGILIIFLQGQTNTQNAYNKGLYVGTHNVTINGYTETQLAAKIAQIENSKCQAYVNGTILYVLNCTKSRINLPATFYAMNTTDINNTINEYYGTSSNWVIVTGTWNCSNLNITQTIAEPHLAENNSAWFSANGLKGVTLLTYNGINCNLLSVRSPV